MPFCRALCARWVYRLSCGRRNGVLTDLDGFFPHVNTYMNPWPPGIRRTCARRERPRKPSSRMLGYPVDPPKETADPLIRVYRLTYSDEADGSIRPPQHLKMTRGATLRQRQGNRTREQKAIMVVRLALNFPNRSRSYNATRHCVRFWAYDEVLEISFFVEEDALCRMDPKATRSEAGFLNALNLHRVRIFKAAGRVYSRHSKGSYTLAASDLQ